MRQRIENNETSALSLPAVLERLLKREDLDEAQARELMRALTDESVPQALAGGILSALRAKGETPAEIRGFATGMRELARRPDIPGDLPAIDSVGTGGDSSGSLNLSTGVALLGAACGLRVVKHGNRSVSSRSGSADVLEALGMTLPLDETAAAACLEACGFTFLFAPHYHPAMKAVAPIRKALGVRTVFNMLGPLTNPAAPAFHLIGAYAPDAARLMAETLAGMAIERAFVVHGEPGWDEATPIGPFLMFDVSPGRVSEERRDPRDYGLSRCAAQDLKGGDAEHNAKHLEGVLRSEQSGPHRDALTLGAGLMLELMGKVDSLGEGIAAAGEALDDGAGARVLDGLRSFSRG